MPLCSDYTGKGQPWKLYTLRSSCLCVVTTLVRSSFDDLVPSIFDVSIKERGLDEMGSGTGAREPSTYSLH